ncbi:hypothetical protein ACN22W_07650 [Burkholderia theae]|uniref:hypothetical protein n=1 Tax=Burkholderia theae TaxID=3143496 RepID=UPI003AFAD696
MIATVLCSIQPLMPILLAAAADRNRQRYAARDGNPHSSLIEKDDGRFAAHRYRAVTRRDIDAHGEPSDCMPIDPARPGFAASRAIQGAASVTTAVATLVIVFDKGH